MNKERPLVTASGRSNQNETLYLNKEGIAALRKALDEMEATKKPVKFPVYQDGDWNNITIEPSDQEDFDGGTKPCRCGCQEEFKDVEKAFKESVKKSKS